MSSSMRNFLNSAMALGCSDRCSCVLGEGGAIKAKFGLPSNLPPLLSLLPLGRGQQLGRRLAGPITTPYSTS